MLSCVLLGVVSLGCGRFSGPRVIKEEAADPITSESSAEDEKQQPSYDDAALLRQLTEATPQGEPGLHHGSPTRTDWGTGPEVRLDVIMLTAPATWKRTKPSSSYYLAEFAIPHAEKDSTDARLLVSVGSGAIDTNIDVFKGQFDTPSEHAKQEQKEIAGFQVTFVDVSGAYTGQHAQSAAAATHPNYRMILAVIPIGDRLHFIKAVGPQQTIAANVEAINTFVRSVRRRNADFEVPEAAGTGTEVRLKPLTFTAPATWKRTKPRSSLVQVEFALPHADKDTVDGRLTVSVVAGTVQDNVERWKGQFVGAIDSPKQEEIKVGGLKATLVDFTGTFGEQTGMMGPVVKRPDYRMIAAIIPISDQLYVVKAVGPRQTVAANAATINAFVGSLKRD